MAKERDVPHMEELPGSPMMDVSPQGIRIVRRFRMLSHEIAYIINLIQRGQMVYTEPDGSHILLAFRAICIPSGSQLLLHDQYMTVLVLYGSPPESALHGIVADRVSTVLASCPGGTDPQQIEAFEIDFVRDPLGVAGIYYDWLMEHGAIERANEISVFRDMYTAREEGRYETRHDHRARSQNAQWGHAQLIPPVEMSTVSLPSNDPAVQAATEEVLRRETIANFRAGIQDAWSQRFGPNSYPVMDAIQHLAPDEGSMGDGGIPAVRVDGIFARADGRPDRDGDILDPAGMHIGATPALRQVWDEDTQQWVDRDVLAERIASAQPLVPDNPPSTGTVIPNNVTRAEIYAGIGGTQADALQQHIEHVTSIIESQREMSVRDAEQIADLKLQLEAMEERLAVLTRDNLNAKDL